MVSRRSLLGTGAAVSAASVAGATTGHAATAPKHHRQSTDANKQLVRDYAAQVFNGHQPELAVKFVTPDFVWHGGFMGTVSGVEGLVGLIGSWIESMPNLNAEELDILAEGDLVTVRYFVTATVRGSLLGIPADGKQLSWESGTIWRITDGKISEEWPFDDTASVLVQLGVLTSPSGG
ncbi:ester cyclase [Streptomyces sp. NPDC006602]|uniref:ester cyclase n=1 Tax=Streptomyces sp. NPDC006602 TaxID=3364751 RepID=UPI0036833622